MTHTVKATIQNRSRAPQGVYTADGLRFVASGSQLTAEFDEASLAQAKRLQFLKVEAATDPLDHDGDGSKGGSVDELDQMKVPDLKALAEAEGVDLQDATKKDDIIAAIRLHREANAEAGE